MSSFQKSRGLVQRKEIDYYYRRKYKEGGILKAKKYLFPKKTGLLLYRIIPKESTVMGE